LLKGHSVCKKKQNDVGGMSREIVAERFSQVLPIILSALWMSIGQQSGAFLISVDQQANLFCNADILPPIMVKRFTIPNAFISGQEG
jgi:hypothetical protein